MKKLSLVLILAASLIATACGSEAEVESTPPASDARGPDGTPPNGNGNGGGPGNGGGGGAGAADVPPDADGGTGDTDGGTGGDQDSGTGGGDTDGGTGGGDTDGGSGGGDTDGGSGGGDQDSGTGGGDTDGGSGGGDTDGGTGGGGDQDGGSGGGETDGGSGGGEQDGGGSTCQPHSCTYTQGFYKNHTSSVTGLTLGGVSYSQSEVLGFLSATPNGDDSIILAKQLIAALLNGGACDPNSSATVQAAQDWLAANKDQDGRLPYGTTCVSQSDPGCTAWSLGQTLDTYNSGGSGTPHCD